MTTIHVTRIWHAPIANDSGELARHVEGHSDSLCDAGGCAGGGDHEIFPLDSDAEIERGGVYNIDDAGNVFEICE